MIIFVVTNYNSQIMKKILVLGFIYFLLSSYLNASEPLWLRYPAISPDGKTIAFNYKGDIYVVNSKGGRALPLVSHPAYDYTPIWSPDGSKIAFASDRYGNFDIFTADIKTGQINRVTTHSNDEQPWSFSPDCSKIYFSANLHTSAASRVYTKKPYLRELYSVSATGGAPSLILPTSSEEISFLPDNTGFLYQNRPGAEEIWRKHHTSAVTMDICLYKNGKHTKLTTSNYENRVPRISSDGSTVYFLSEQDGSFNVYSFKLDNPSEITRQTNHKLHPVRSLSLSNNGVICYSYDGSIYTKKEGSKPVRLKITLPKTASMPTPMRDIAITPTDCATISPDGSQMVFAYRGELYVTSTDSNPTSRRLTSTVASEADPVFSPDGRTLIYASERQGKWNLFSMTLAQGDRDFLSAKEIIETPLFNNHNFDRRKPIFSPDGKELAFIESRSRVMVMTLADNTVRQIVDGSQVAQSSGYFPYSWSPDGKWIVLEGDLIKHKTNILLVNASGKEPMINLTRSGYPDSEPVWAGYNAILFSSQRYGSYDQSRVGGGTKSLFLLFLNQKAQEFYSTPEEYREALGLVPLSDLNSANTEVEPLEFNDRIVQLTKTPVSNIIVDNEGTFAYGISNKQLVRIDLSNPESKIKQLGQASGKLSFDTSQKTIFVLGSKPLRYDLQTSTFLPINVSGIYSIDSAAEYMYMFNHIENEMYERFYDLNMHGVDWKMYCNEYRKFIPHINNNYDFSELAGELLGELNVSHTGLRYDRPVNESHDATGELGLFIDYRFKGNGLKVDEILQGGPFDRTSSLLEKGDVIINIDGVDLTSGMDYFPLLNHKAGKLISVKIQKSNGDIISENVLPITRKAYDNLLYQRWMARNAADVERLSNGRLGYIHLDLMNKPAYHHLYLNSLGRYYNCDALVFDVRDNGGGSLHPRIEEFFSGKQYLTGEVRGIRTKDMPRRRWIRPSVALINEGCYSDGHGSPWVYDHLDLGTTVGMPIPGTMTTCVRERQRDETLILGVPIVGFYTKQGNSLENTQQEPDVCVENKKEALATGIDNQLEAAVKLLLEQLETHPKRKWEK